MRPNARALTRRSRGRAGDELGRSAQLPDGSYQLVLEYEPELPSAREPYIPFEYDGVTWWRGSGLGYSIPTQERRYPITVAGQPLTVVFTN